MKSVLHAHKFAISTAIASFLLAAAILWFILSLFSGYSTDAAAYRELVALAAPVNSTAQLTPYSAKQHRKNVQKEILFNQNEERLQIRLNSKEAILILDREEDSTEVIEKLKDVACLMQEELFYLLPDGREALKQPNGKLLARQGSPVNASNWAELNTPGVKKMQQLRYMEADEATYYYKTDRFTASNVKISRFTAPEHRMPLLVKGLKPTMNGVAKSVEFTLSGGELNFKASNLRASFYTEKSL